MFKISEFSRFTRISVKMLRHYDELGLLKPVSIDPESNYRYYSSDQLPRLNRIIAFKDLGFKLDQIGRLLDENLSPDEIRGMFRMRQVEIEQNLQLEHARLRQVETRLRYLEQDAQHLKYDVVLRDIAPQRVASIRQEIMEGDGQIHLMFEELEGYVSQFQVRTASSPLTIYYDEEYQERISDVETAVPIEQPVPETDRIKVSTLPEVPLAACVVYTGSYDRSDEVLNTIMIWIEANGYQSNGPLREVYLRFGADEPEAMGLPKAFIADQSELFVTEIQLPVERAVGSKMQRSVGPSTGSQRHRRVGQILLPVQDLERAVRFYRDILGLKLLSETSGAAFFDCDGIRLVMSLVEKGEFQQPGQVVYYRVNDIEAEYDLLVSRGVIFEGQIQLMPGTGDQDLRVCFFYDSEGNRLGLMSEVFDH